jgi:hypothetical protein
MPARRSARKTEGAGARRRHVVEDEVILQGFADFDPCYHHRSAYLTYSL